MLSKISISWPAAVPLSTYRRILNEGQKKWKVSNGFLEDASASTPFWAIICATAYDCPFSLKK